ncbi:MAG: hypothetical protein QXE81_05575 [Desulfurococcaceae archaeon]
MNKYEVFTHIRDLVNDLDVLITEGKRAILTKDLNGFLLFVNGLKRVFENASWILVEAREVTLLGNKEDKLVKYISTYYRMITLISLPYIVSMLRESRDLLEKQGYINEVRDVDILIDRAEDILGTLRH